MNTLSRLKAIRDSADHIATWTERDGLDRSRLASIANHAEVVAQDYAALLAACKALADRFERRVSDNHAKYPELAAAHAAIAKASGETA